MRHISSSNTASVSLRFFISCAFFASSDFSLLIIACCLLIVSLYIRSFSCFTFCVALYFLYIAYPPNTTTAPPIVHPIGPVAAPATAAAPKLASSVVISLDNPAVPVRTWKSKHFISHL